MCKGRKLLTKAKPKHFERSIVKPNETKHKPMRLALKPNFDNVTEN